VPNTRCLSHRCLRQHSRLLLLHGLWPGLHSSTQRPLVWRYSTVGGSLWLLKFIISMQSFSVICSSTIWPTIIRHYLLLLAVIRDVLTCSLCSGRSLLTGKKKEWHQAVYSWCECVLVMMSVLCVNSDVNECEDTSLCLGGQCTNNIGSYSCSCPSGLELVDGTSCRGMYRYIYTYIEKWLAVSLSLPHVGMLTQLFECLCAYLW